jgi:hypothetical protein
VAARQEQSGSALAWLTNTVRSVFHTPDTRNRLTIVYNGQQNGYHKWSWVECTLDVARKGRSSSRVERVYRGQQESRLICAGAALVDAQMGPQSGGERRRGIRRGDWGVKDERRKQVGRTKSFLVIWNMLQNHGRVVQSSRVLRVIVLSTGLIAPQEFYRKLTQSGVVPTLEQR